MLLGLQNTASGTNLTEATHILLLGWPTISLSHSCLDPMQGTKAEANAVEMQAVGRAHRQGQNKAVSSYSGVSVASDPISWK